MHYLSGMSLGAIAAIVIIALALPVGVFVVIRRSRNRFRDLEDEVFDQGRKLDALLASFAKIDPLFGPVVDNGLATEPDTKDTQKVDVRSPRRERSTGGKVKMWHVIVAAVIALLVAVQFIPRGSSPDDPKEHARTGKHAKTHAPDQAGNDEAPVASAGSNACAKCKPDRPGGIIDTDPNAGYIFADKCVGDGDCASCKPVGCVGENASAPPSCTACSRTGK